MGARAAPCNCRALASKGCRRPPNLPIPVLPLLHGVTVFSNCTSYKFLCTSAKTTSSTSSFVFGKHNPLNPSTLSDQRAVLVCTSEKPFSSVFLQSLEDAQNISTLDHAVPGVRPAQCESSCQHHHSGSHLGCCARERSSFQPAGTGGIFATV